MKKLNCLMLLFLIIAAGCQKEDDAHVHRHEESGLKMRKITFEEMKSKPLAVEALNRVKVNEGKGSQQAKLLYDSSNDFYVDTDEIIYIEKDEYHSFTLAVYRDHNAPFFENLVMSLQKDGSYNATLVSYDLTEQEKADLESERLYSLEGKVQATVLDGGSMTPEMLMSRVSCIYITVPTCSYGDSVHFAGSGCTQVDGTYTISVCSEEAAPVYYISGPGGGSPSPGSSGSGSSGPVGGSGTSPAQPSEPSPGSPDPITEPDPNNPQEPLDDFEDTLITVPLLNSPSPIERFVARVNNDAEQSAWWNEPANAVPAQSIVNYLNQNTVNNVINPEAAAFAAELIVLALLEPNQDDANKLVQLTLLIEASGNNFFTDEFAETLMPYLDLGQTAELDPHFPGLLSLKTYLNYKKLRALNPEWSRATCIWHATKDIIHISLDVFGLIPVGGEIADIVNGVLYTIEGDGINATLSYASAVPIAGWATVGVKYSLKVVNQANDIASKVKLVWKVLPDGKIYFGSNSHCRATLRKVLGLGVGNANQAHHVIPLNLQTNPVVQKAAKSGNAFHMNEALNGIPLNNAVHSGSHGHYDDLIENKLLNYASQNPNATPQQCHNFVSNLIQQIRTAIQNNPTTPINQLNF